MKKFVTALVALSLAATALLTLPAAAGAESRIDTIGDTRKSYRPGVSADTKAAYEADIRKVTVRYTKKRITVTTRFVRLPKEMYANGFDLVVRVSAGGKRHYFDFGNHTGVNQGRSWLGEKTVPNAHPAKFRGSFSSFLLSHNRSPIRLYPPEGSQKYPCTIVWSKQTGTNGFFTFSFNKKCAGFPKKAKKIKVTVFSAVGMRNVGVTSDQSRVVTAKRHRA